MEMPLYNQEAEKVGTVKLNDSVFAVPMNRDLLYQVVTAQTSNRRQVIAHAKGRSEVRGGGKKPWQQKGTGRARHGSIRSPIWKGGGVAHGPSKDKNFKKNINQAAAHKALAVALSAKVRDGQVLIVDSIVPSEKKTKAVNAIFNKVVSVFASTTKRSPSVLFVLPAQESQELFRLSKNLPTVSAQEARNLNSLDVLSSKYLVFLKDAVGDVEKLIK